jgi:hypothetical protein
LLGLDLPKRADGWLNFIFWREKFDRDTPHYSNFAATAHEAVMVRRFHDVYLLDLVSHGLFLVELGQEVIELLGDGLVFLPDFDEPVEQYVAVPVRLPLKISHEVRALVSIERLQRTFDDLQCLLGIVTAHAIAPALWGHTQVFRQHFDICFCHAQGIHWVASPMTFIELIVAHIIPYSKSQTQERRRAGAFSSDVILFSRHSLL